MKFQMQSAGPSNRFLDDPDEDERDSDAELGAETDEDDDVDMAPPGVTLHALRPSPIKPHAKPQERTTIMPKTKRANSAEERPEPKSRVIASPDERRAVDARILAAFNSFQAKHSRMPTWAELAEAANAPGATLGARRQRVGFALKRAGVSGKAYTLGVGVPGREAFLAGRSDAASSVGTPGTAGQRGSVTVAEPVRATGPGPEAQGPRDRSTLKADLAAQREAALAVVTSAAARVQALTLAIQAIDLV